MLSLYRPFTSLLRDEFGERDWNPFFSGGPMARAASFSPAVDVVEKDGAYLLKAEVPGLAGLESEEIQRAVSELSEHGPTRKISHGGEVSKCS